MRAVLTAIYDEYDSLKPVLPQSGEPVDWVCVSDHPQDPGLGWRVILDRSAPGGVHPNRKAKRPKMTPWQYTEATESVWLDASFRITSPTAIKEMLSFADPIAQWVHPWRDCIYDEAIESSLLPKYKDEDVLKQVEEYRSWGMPEHWGLWATGAIARKHTPEITKLGTMWRHETWVRTYQDQLSEAPWLWKLGLRPTSFPATYFASPWLAYEGSGRH